MITIIINSYGNLGRGVERAISRSDDLELVAVSTRRDPSTVKTLGAPVARADAMAEWADIVGVCINCGGSVTDLEEQEPAAARLFNTADSFDAHSRISTYFTAADEATKAAGHVSLISAGWDPGLFSVLRVLDDTVLPDGASMTFWDPGVPQRHSGAIRRIEGIVDAYQYMPPVKSTVHAVKNGEEVELTTYSMHAHTYYVIVEEGTDLERIKWETAETPNYPADYDIIVTFISAEELATEHSGLPRGRTAIRHGTISEDVYEFTGPELALESNPEFTGSVLTATARVVVRKTTRGESGVRIVFDVSLSELSAKTPEELRAY